MDTEYFTCACKTPEHTLRFVYFEEDDGSYADIEIEVMLQTLHLTWYQRLWIGIKYILGLKANNCHFDGWMLDEKDLDRLIELCQKLKKNG